jgi:signal transduction histidine kinase/DNA-binding NarL/FixJ family response regulator
MLVFGTQMHMVTFIFVSIEIVILLYLIIFRLARPDDKTALLNLALIFLLLIYNVTGGLLPDPQLPGSYFLQVSAAYATGFITPCYFPFYAYKAFGLNKLKFHAYKGVFLFLVLPYLLFVIVFAHSGNLKTAQTLLILPVLYAIWIIILVYRAIQYKYKNDLNSIEAKQELIVFLLSLAPWICLPVVDYFDMGQVAEAAFTNLGFLLLFGLQVRRNIVQLRTDHDRLIESEARLKLLNESLKDEVKKRTKELEEANQIRTNNFINLVHETKTPLTLIKNYLDEYVDKYGPVEELDIIKGGVDKLTSDVINLFDVERFSKGIDVYRHNKITDFSGILKSCLPLFEQYCMKQNISSTSMIEESLFIKADPNSVNRIVNNLIENAIKFTNTGGEIVVSLSHEDDKILFSVKDTGIGIHPSLHRKIFEPYYQIGHKESGLQGMGLGLPIVKKVVDGLGGEIVVDSNPVHAPGTTVTIILNKYELMQGDSPERGSNEISKSNYQLTECKIEDSVYSPDKRSVLLLEDNKSMLRFLFKKLSATYNVFCALNGADALKKLHEMHVIPDLILTDIMMDKMDGFTFAKIISEQASFNHIPIIFLTAKSTAADRLKGLRLGAIDFISKPFSYEELIQKIETILASISKQQAAVLNSVVNMSTRRSIRFDISSEASDSRFLENCRLLGLTQRETEVSRLLVRGKTSKEIANDLFISDKTVTKHIQNIFGKAAVSNKVNFINKVLS